MSTSPKITKEAPIQRQRILSNNRSSRLTFSSSGLESGYRGFTDFGYSIGVGDGEGRIELSSSHGAQIGQYFFIGAGLGLNYFHDSECVGLPIFAHLRSDFLDNKVSPFAEIKIGYSILDVDGFYLSPSFGCRIALNNNMAVNLSLGYTMLQTDYYYYNYYGDYYTDTANCGGLTFKVGLEF